MKKVLIVFVISFFSISCSQSEEEVKRQSLDDVYFYLSNYNIVKNVDQINLVSYKKVNELEYQLKYNINNNSSLWLIHYYNKENYLYNFFYTESNDIKKITDSINIERRKHQYFPLHKRWDWVGTVSKVK